MTHRNDGRF